MTAALPAMLTARLAKELKQLTLSPPPGITVHQAGDSLLQYTAQIMGPPDTPYEGGVYTVDVTVPQRYPFTPPQCQFKTPVYHPNIDDTGRICCSILSLPPSGTWKPVHNIAAVLTSLYSLLQSPNCDDPLMHNIAQQLQNDRAEYERTAREWNDKYAVQRQHEHAADSAAATTVAPATTDDTLQQSSESVAAKAHGADTEPNTPPRKRLKQ